MSANSVFVNTKLFDYVNNFSNNYPNVYIYIHAAKVKQMVQVVPVKHEAKERNLKQERLIDLKMTVIVINLQTTLNQPQSQREALKQVRILFVIVQYAIIAWWTPLICIITALQCTKLLDLYVTQMAVTKCTILSMATFTTSKSTALRNH